jgi:hypothetical protein
MLAPSLPCSHCAGPQSKGGPRARLKSGGTQRRVSAPDGRAKVLSRVSAMPGVESSGPREARPYLDRLPGDPLLGRGGGDTRRAADAVERPSMPANPQRGRLYMNALVGLDPRCSACRSLEQRSHCRPSIRLGPMAGSVCLMPISHGKPGLDLVVRPAAPAPRRAPAWLSKDRLSGSGSGSGGDTEWRPRRRRRDTTIR